MSDLLNHIIGGPDVHMFVSAHWRTLAGLLPWIVGLLALKTIIGRMRA